MTHVYLHPFVIVAVTCPYFMCLSETDKVYLQLIDLGIDHAIAIQASARFPFSAESAVTWAFDRANDDGGADESKQGMLRPPTPITSGRGRQVGSCLHCPAVLERKNRIFNANAVFTVVDGQSSTLIRRWL